MTTSHNSSVLKDVVAYVDVWSSDKSANYSKPFIQQLQEMGAQVSKTFNKQVTHLVFNNGHPASWRKAKKSDVRLVSVLWVGRCYDDGVRVDEDLYPAINDESNPVLKNRKHRCMQPKDSSEKTPENDRRMRRKLDKMMKDIAPKQPLVADASPIIIDEENGIVYSPALKRSAYMAQRLKDMKEKRENLSPTASQMVESCSTAGLKPSLGSTPTVLKLMFDQSDEDSSASVAEPSCSPDKEERRTKVDVAYHRDLEKRPRKCSENRQQPSCSEVPRKLSSPLKCPDFEDEAKGNSRKKPRRTSVRLRPTKEHTSVDILESTCQARGADNRKKLCKAQSQSRIKPLSPSPQKTEKGKRKMKADDNFTETNVCPDDVNSSTSSPSTSGDVAFDSLKKAAAPFQKRKEKMSKRARPSLSALVKSFRPSGESDGVGPGATDAAAAAAAAADDDVFEDYFSPANHQRPKKSLFANQPEGKDIHIPFELDPVPKKRKERRSESAGSVTNNTKKRKLEESRTGEDSQPPSDARGHPRQHVKEPPSAFDRSSASVALVAKKRRQSTLPFTSTSATLRGAVKRRRASVHSTVLTEDNAVLELEKQSDVSLHSHTVESRGNECKAAAAVTDIPTEAELPQNKPISFNLQEGTDMRTLVMTSMPSEKQNTVVQVVKVLGGFVIVDRVCESTTHVVSGGQRRTINVLLGIARGCWILSFDWILWCLEQRQWIPEEPYELSDQFPAAQICRLQRHLSAGEHQQDLFQGQPAIFVSQHSQPPTQSLVELIQLCGGTVCKTVRQAGICIGRHSGRRPEGSRLLSEQWVLDSISNLKQLSYDNYDLE